LTCEFSYLRVVDRNRVALNEIVDARNAVKILLGIPTQNGLVDRKIAIAYLNSGLRLERNGKAQCKLKSESCHRRPVSSLQWFVSCTFSRL